MDTYRIVDQSTKVRMEELLATWRYSGPNGTALFGPSAQMDIERRLYGNAVPRVTAAPPSAIRPPFPQATYGNNPPSHIQQQPSQRTRTLERLDRLLAIGSHDQHHNPHLFDGNRMQALGKLRTLVADMPLSGDELNQIDMQLDTLEAEIESRRQTMSLAPSVPTPVMMPPSVSIASSSTHSPRPNNGPVSLPPNLAGALANFGKMGVGSSTPPVSHAALSGNFSTSAAPAALGAPAQDLIAKLQQAGLFRAATATPPAVTVVQQDLEYSNMILSLNLKLTTADMQRELPLGSLEAITFKELSLQCRQCSNRYPAGPKGQESMDRHLDWHFRQNRRARDSTARGQSRSWFSRLEEWIRGGHDDDAPKRLEDSAGTNGTSSTTSLTPAQEAELKAATNAFVIAPIDDPQAATKPCPICKELFKAEMSQDEDDFIWKNCVNIKGIYYHGSCHYSAKIFSSAVKSSTGSREGTPAIEDQAAAKATGSRLDQIKEEDGKTAVAPIAGTKRKAETIVKEEEDEGSAQKIARPSIGEEIAAA
jgi:pre-mRNA cleavage complex 2 protein Pcf11